MKLWEKGIPVNEAIEQFTVGRDRELDSILAPYDILGSLAHAAMLKQIGLLSELELLEIRAELIRLYQGTRVKEFVIEPGVEDVHSQIELLLTRKLGDTGKRIHTARSRNDQILLDLKLFIRDEIKQLVDLTEKLFHQLQQKSEKTRDILLPGYTHLQMAMPSSFGLWFGAYAESLVDDMQLLLAAYRIVNQNPLGSAAGYGSSFPVDRQLTTTLLGFDSMNYNVVYAQMGRGKVERTVSFAMASLAATLSKMAYDCCLYMNRNFGFITLPDEFTTGSSIMPHKKNPDVFELIRAKCNQIQNLPAEISLVINNLPSGYFRDMQIIKESFIPAFYKLESCLSMACLMVDKLEVNPSILNNNDYDCIFSVEEVNKLVMKGIPFRDAYRKIADAIKSGTFHPEKLVSHSHEGSIGNPCNEKIAVKMRNVLNEFHFERMDKALEALVKDGKK